MRLADSEIIESSGLRLSPSNLATLGPLAGRRRHAPDAYRAGDTEFVRWWKETVRGKGEKANSADRGYFVDDAESLSGITHQQVSRWAKHLKTPDVYRAQLFGKAYAAAMECKAATVRGTEGTGENEWYTPREYIDAAGGRLANTAMATARR